MPHQGQTCWTILGIESRHVAGVDRLEGSIILALRSLLFFRASTALGNSARHLPFRPVAPPQTSLASSMSMRGVVPSLAVCFSPCQNLIDGYCCFRGLLCATNMPSWCLCNRSQQSQHLFPGVGLGWTGSFSGETPRPQSSRTLKDW